MFKALGIIESFGTGIGEAKRSLEENGSPMLYYKLFDANDNVTSVVIPEGVTYISDYAFSNCIDLQKRVQSPEKTRD